MQKADLLEKSLMLGKLEGRIRGCKRLRWLDGITDAMNMNLGKLGEGQRDLASCSPWGQNESDKMGQLNNNNPLLSAWNNTWHI